MELRDMTMEVVTAMASNNIVLDIVRGRGKGKGKGKGKRRGGMGEREEEKH